MIPDYQYLRRRSVSDSLKRTVLYRDNYSCCYCQTAVTFETVHMDHAFPRSRGGLTTFENLRSSCSSCDLAKSDKTELECRMELASRANSLSYLAGLLGSSLRKGPY